MLRCYNPSTGLDTASGGLIFTGASLGCLLTPNGMLCNTAFTASQAGRLDYVPVTSSSSPITSLTGADSTKSAASYLWDMALRQVLMTALQPYAFPYIGGNLSAKNGSLYFASNSVGNGLTSVNIGGVAYTVLVPPANGVGRLVVAQQ